MRKPDPLDRGLCRGRGAKYPASFWTDQDPARPLTANSQAAAAECARCPVADLCLASGVDLARRSNYIIFGIWAGDTIKAHAEAGRIVDEKLRLDPGPVVEILAERKISKRGLARLLDVDGTALCRWFQVGLKPEQARRIAGALGTTADALWPDALPVAA